MSTAYNKIIAKLQSLDEYLTYLDDLQKVNKKSFLSDYHFYGLAEHYLHLSIEVMVDVGKLIIISYHLPRPEEKVSTFEILFENNIINENLYDKLSGIVGFRNILIHEYEKINTRLIYEYLQNNIDQFRDYKKQVLRFLKKRNI